MLCFIESFTYNPSLVSFFHCSRSMAKLKKISTEQTMSCSSLLGGIFWSPRRRKLALPENANPKIIDNSKNPKRNSIDSSALEKPSIPKPQLKPKPKLETHLPRKSSDSARTEHKKFTGKYCVMGNIIVKPQCGELDKRVFHGGLTVKNRLDPEVLKKMGNEAYARGRFQEALVFYEKAISIDPKKATYWCNKSAALISMDRLVEACDACDEAIRLDPNYGRAHQRLAKLYLRLGEAEKALCHYEQAGKYADVKDREQAQDIVKCTLRCKEARRSKEWKILLKETNFAISYGVDSSPLVFALQAEALLHLHKHQEAYEAYRKGTIFFSMDAFVKLFGLPLSSYILMVGAQVYIAEGRFEDAVKTSQQAARLNPSDGEANKVVKRAKAIASARLSGNLLFKASKFDLACLVYTEGLEQDPYNALLLCNRAACRYKLGQFEKAVEDCTAALDSQPSYPKARRRRADSNAKLEKWQAAIQDYEWLVRENPGDEEIGRALSDAIVGLKLELAS